MKTTETANVKIRNTQINVIRDKQQHMDALAESHKLDTYALHDLEKEVRVNTPDIIKQIQVKINEHIANVEHYLKVIIPNLIAHSHKYKKYKAIPYNQKNKNLQEVLHNITTNNIEATQTLKLKFDERYISVVTPDKDEDEE